MIRWYRRRKLIHQIGFVILAGFCVSFLLILYLLSSEKSERLNDLSSAGAIQRVISVVGILSQTPPELHPSIIQASRSPNLSLSISRFPGVGATLDTGREVAELMNQMNQAGIATVNLSLIHQTRPIVDMDRMRRAMMSGMRMNIGAAYRSGYLATIDGSVLLNSGEWLNFSSGVNQAMTHWSTGVMISLAVVMIGTIVISLLIIRNALKPVRAMGDAAAEFALNKSVSPVISDGPQDLYPTIRAFNDMQTRLTDYIRERTKLLAAISHDLRTPLTSLRLRLEFIEDSEDKQQMLRTISTMEKMLHATLRFAKQDGELEARCPTDVHTLMQTIVDEYADKAVSIRYQPQADLINNIPPLSVRRMVENLINNSVQYGGENNTVTLMVHNECDQMVITVTDTGVGIDEHEFEEVVKPFTRLNSARDTEASNVGLGLSITQSLAVAHGGTLRLEPNRPRGLKAIVTISLS
jgi:signal transduction histidine kinase